jgi:hypothetical protein
MTKMTVGKKLAAATVGAGLLGAGVLGMTSVVGATTTAPTAATTATTTTHHPRWAAHEARVAALEAKAHEIATSGTLPARFSCSNASTATARITKLENRIDQLVPLATAREQRATANGHTAWATAISNGIAKAEVFKSDLTTISGLISAKCGS